MMIPILETVVANVTVGWQQPVPADDVHGNASSSSNGSISYDGSSDLC